MASVACVECAGQFMVDSKNKKQKNNCIHGIKQWLFCRECENWLQNIKKLCEKNHPLNINYKKRKLIMENNFIKIHINGINDLDSYFNNPQIKEEKEKFVKEWKPPKYEKEDDK